MLNPKHNLNEILFSLQKDKTKIKEYIFDLYKKYIPIYEKLYIEKPLISIVSFYPLPCEFQIDYLNEENESIRTNGKNNYQLHGDSGDRILFGNRRLPMYDIDPIPFSFPITENNITRIIQTSTYYFEVTIGKRFRKPWANECVAIGYGNPSANYNSQLGWCSKTWGFHSDDGIFIHNNVPKYFTNPWKKGETYGVGLKYLSKGNYLLFLTKNGFIVNKEIHIQTYDVLLPMISLDISLDVKVNFGQENFQFNLRNYSNDNKILSYKNMFFTSYSIKAYFIKPTKSNKIIINKKELPQNIIPLFDSLGVLTNNTYNLNPIEIEKIDTNHQLMLINNFTNNFVVQNKFDFSPFMNIDYKFFMNNKENK